MGLIIYRMMRLQTVLYFLEPKNVAVEIAPLNSVGFPKKAYRLNHSVMELEIAKSTEF